MYDGGHYWIRTQSASDPLKHRFLECLAEENAKKRARGPVFKLRYLTGGHSILGTRGPVRCHLRRHRTSPYLVTCPGTALRAFLGKLPYARLTASLAAIEVRTDFSAILLAAAIASSISFLAGTTRDTRPARSASSAVMKRPVKFMSIDFDFPTNRVRR